jgi:hypothetical protein
VRKLFESWGQFGNPEEGKYLSLEAVTRRLVNTVTEDSIECVMGSAKCSNKLYQSPINPITKPNPV